MVIGIAIIMVAIIGVTYAYYVATVTTDISDGNNEVDVTTSALTIATMTNSGEITANGIYPGWMGVKAVNVSGSCNATTCEDIKAYITITPTISEEYGTDVTWALYKSSSPVTCSGEDITDGGEYYSIYTCDTTGAEEVMSGSTEVKVQEIVVTQTTNDNYYLVVKYVNNEEASQDAAKGKTFSISVDMSDTSSVTSNITTATDYIINLATEAGADTSSTDEIGSTGLAYDGTTDNNLRYIGSNPNNYVTFNGETWRIIGVMNNVNDGTTTESRVKLIRSESLGDYSWDSSESSVNSGYGINEWSQADLMTELNGDYLNTSLTANTTWYNGSNNTKTAEFDYTTVLTSEAQAMVDTVIWNTGAADWDTYKGKLVSDYYTAERGTTTYIGTSDGVTRTTTWTGKVALMYPSDYGYATSGNESTTRSTCLATSLQYLSKNSWYQNSDCYNNDWLYDSSYNQWTMLPISSYSNRVSRLRESGDINNPNSHKANAVRPVLYLKSSIKIASGDGTSTNPYVLEA